MSSILYFRKLLILVCVIVACSSSKGQTLEAHYKIGKTVYKTNADGTKAKIATLAYTGVIYQDGSKFISFRQPLYLDDYPDGFIRIEEDGNKETQYGIPMDTVQGIFYINFDSLNVRQRVDLPGKNTAGLNLLKKFHKEYVIWQYEPDTKVVNGLKCQKATFVNRNGLLQWVVWFCPDIPAIAGPDGIVNLPGLVVEAENKVSDLEFTLEGYTTGISIPAETFWPKSFFQPWR